MSTTRQPSLDERGDAAHGGVDVDELLLEGADLAGLQDGVAAQGDDDGAGRPVHAGPLTARAGGSLPAVALS